MPNNLFASVCVKGSINEPECKARLKNMVDAMISKKFAILGLTFMIAIFFLLALYYFTSSMLKSYRLYRQMKVKIEQEHNQLLNESLVTDKDDNILNDVILPKGFRDFEQGIKKTYGRYNEAKAQHISMQYGSKEDTDTIDTSIIFPRHDRYVSSEDQ